MDTLWQDMKYAVRGLGRSPGFALAVVAALALGIGANAVIFSVVNAVLLHPLAFRELKDPDRLAMVWEKNPLLSLFFANRMPPRLRNVRAWKEQSRSFEDLGAWSDTTVTLTSGNDRAGLQPEQVEAGTVSANLLPLLGIHVRLGRTFTDADAKSGKGQVVILSDELYQSRYGVDSHILDKTIIAGGQQYRVIGVLPPGFQLPAVWGGFDQKKPRLWFPLDMHPSAEQDESFSQYVFGRLRPGVGLEQARAEMDVISKRLADSVPDKNKGFGVNVASLAEEDVGPELRRALAVLQVAVLFVLLIACANVGNLSLTRAVARDKEIAVRAALGAGRLRIVRQTLTESILLSLVAAGVGLLLSFWATKLVSFLAPKDTHGLHELRIDGTVLAVSIGVAILSGILFGLAPASHALKNNLNEVLNRSSRSVAGSSQRLRNVLVAAEIALSLILLIGAGLMIRSLASLMNTDLGFRRDHLLVMRLELPNQKYSKPEQVSLFNDRLMGGVRQLSGVRSAALTNALPMKSVNQSSIELPGKTFPPGTLPVSDWARTSDAYFETLGIPILKGRSYTREEALASEPDAAVINQAFARTYFANEDPLGKVIVFGNEKGGNTRYRVIGIVGNEHQLGPDGEQHAEFYVPSNQLRSMMLVTRTVGDPLALAAAVKQAVWNIDNQQPVSEVGTEEDALREWTAPRRFNMVILLNFAGIALVLAAVGLYSVLAYSVTLRTREIGIRVALGADPRAVTTFIVRQGLSITLIGIAIGLGGAFLLTRFMQSLIFGVSTVDAVTFAGVALLLMAVSMVASFVPALRAARLDPIQALRTE